MTVIKPVVINDSCSSSSSQSLDDTVTIGVADIVDAMEVIGFQDQGKKKVIELIKDNFNELANGNTDIIPAELFDLTEQIIEVVDYLAEIFT